MNTDRNRCLDDWGWRPAAAIRPWSGHVPSLARRRPCSSALIHAVSVWLLCTLAPLHVLAAEHVGNHTAADFERHVRALRKKLPSDDFTIVVTRPFVVIGDDEPAEVRRRAKTQSNGPSRSSRTPTSAKTPPRFSTSGCLRIRRATKSTFRRFSTPSPTRLTATTRLPIGRW